MADDQEHVTGGPAADVAGVRLTFQRTPFSPWLVLGALPTAFYLFWRQHVA